jgi:hypothetical protein
MITILNAHKNTLTNGYVLQVPNPTPCEKKVRKFVTVVKMNVQPQTHILLPSINSVWLSTLRNCPSPGLCCGFECPRQCFAFGMFLLLLSNSSTELVSNSLPELSFLDTSTPIVTLISLFPGGLGRFLLLLWLTLLLVEKSDIGMLPFSISLAVLFLREEKKPFERLVFGP